jgi:hypothetical protein
MEIGGIKIWMTEDTRNSVVFSNFRTVHVQNDIHNTVSIFI